METLPERVETRRGLEALLSHAKAHAVRRPGSKEHTEGSVGRAQMTGCGARLSTPQPRAFRACLPEPQQTNTFLREGEDVARTNTVLKTCPQSEPNQTPMFS